MRTGKLQLQDRKKEVVITFTSGILFAYRHVRVKSLHGAAGD